MSTRNTREKVRKARQASASSAYLDSCCREADRLVAEQRRKRDANRRHYFEAYIAYQNKKTAKEEGQKE